MNLALFGSLPRDHRGPSVLSFLSARIPLERDRFLSGQCRCNRILQFVRLRFRDQHMDRGIVHTALLNVLDDSVLGLLKSIPHPDNSAFGILWWLHAVMDNDPTLFLRLTVEQTDAR